MTAAQESARPGTEAAGEEHMSLAEVATSRPAVSAVVPDWSRETPEKVWDPGRRLLRCLRRWQALRGRRGPFARLARRYWSLQHLFWSVVTHCEIQLDTEIGGGLLLPHPNGIVIHPDVRIGPNCMIMNQVTLGIGRHGGVPVLGGHVDVAAGARIVGAVAIGDHAVIGLNAVVLDDVPRAGVAVGVPARVIRIEEIPPD